MTWNDLIDKLNLLPNSALNTDVTIKFEDEIYKVDDGLFVSLNTDVLDAGHPYIAIQMEGEF